jgi:predicted SPOUT superfamily RNA methylase MTH1
VHYHPGKANVVVDALSRKVHCNHLELEPVSDPLCEEMRRLNLEVVERGNLCALAAESNLYDRIVTTQHNDEHIQNIKQKLAEGDPKYICFQKDHKDVIQFGKRLVVPVDPEIRKTIFDEAHMSKFSIHPGSTKMYQDLKQNFWWSNMKVDIAKYVAECDTCHRMKASHLKSAGVLQPLSIPMWKWDDISMDFIVGLPVTAKKERFYLGYHGQTHQDRPFHCSSYHLFSAAICRDIHGSNSSSAWNSEDHNL